MDERPPISEDTQPGDSERSGRGVVVFLYVVAAVLGLVLVGLVVPRHAPTPTNVTGTRTAVSNDAVADYESARASGRPIFVLFHSLS